MRVRFSFVRWIVSSYARRATRLVPGCHQGSAGDKPTSLDGAPSIEGVDYHLKRPRHTQRQNPRIRGELIADLLQELNVSVAEAAAAFGACRAQSKTSYPDGACPFCRKVVRLRPYPRSPRRRSTVLSQGALTTKIRRLSPRPKRCSIGPIFRPARSAAWMATTSGAPSTLSRRSTG
jgi:hypothetical protein